MSDVTTSYGMPFDFLVFFGCFHTLLMIIHILIVVFCLIFLFYVSKTVYKHISRKKRAIPLSETSPPACRQVVRK